MPRPTLTYETRDGRTITVEMAPAGVKGYAAHPGSGPSDQTCGSCHWIKANGRSKTYYKCDLTNWTNGAATDIRVRSLACKYWEAPWPWMDIKRFDAAGDRQTQESK